MAGIRGRNTKVEVRLRKALFARGLRYRIHVRDLPGRPDVVLPRYRAVVMIHGCFWHGHDCELFRLPGTRTAWWKSKIDRNRERDREVERALRETGWRIAHVFECAIRGKVRRPVEIVAAEVARWIRRESPAQEILVLP